MWVADRDAMVGAYADNIGINEQFTFGVIGRQFQDGGMVPEDDTEAPSKVENVQVLAVGPTSATISFDEATDNDQVAGYEIYLNNEFFGITNNNIATVLEGLDSDTTYTIQVLAFDRIGNKGELSTPVEFTTLEADTEAPSPVMNLVISDVTMDSFVVTYDESIDNYYVDHYVIVVNEANQGLFARLFNINELVFTTPNTNFEVTGLNPGTSYEVEVFAVDSSGNESESAFGEVTTNTAMAWDPNQVYATPGTQVEYEGNIYSNKWYQQAGNAPHVDDRYGVVTGWEMIGGKDFDTAPNWNENLNYPAHAVVAHNGFLWEASYWANIGDEPGVADVWVNTGENPDIIPGVPGEGEDKPESDEPIEGTPIEPGNPVDPIETNPGEELPGEITPGEPSIPGEDKPE
jgi:chitodextrinase